MIKLLLYTHSDYNWVWKYWHQQTDKFLKNLVIKSIHKSCPVEFHCDIDYDNDNENGLLIYDMYEIEQLLGIKLAASEFIAYIQLSDLKNITSVIHLNYDKSIIMATYMLCGFANFASIGIQIGGIGSLASGQRKTLSEFGMKALIGGTIASLMSAAIAGMIIG